MVNVPEVGTGNAGSRSIVSKIYSVIGITAAIALVGSYFFSRGEVFYGILTLLVFLTLFALQVILLANADKNLTTAVILNSVAWASFFYSAVSFPFIFAFGFLLFFLFLAGRRGKDELNNSLKVKVSRVVQSVIGFALTAVVIFTFVSMILIAKLDLTEERVYRLTDVVVAPIARHYVQDFTPDMETGTFFAKLAERNLITNRQAINQSVAQLKQDIEGYAGTQIDLRRSVAENLYQALQFKISNLTPQAKIYWALIILGMIFLSVKSIEFLIAFPLILFVFIIYQLLLAFNFISIDIKNRRQEVVLLNK